MATTKKLMGTTAVGGGSLAIEEVFSTYLYTGTSAAQTITNGIDLAGEGGMVWLKSRSNASNHFVVDTERGNDKYLLTNATSAEGTSPAGSDITSFNSDGFSFGNYNYNINFNNLTYASWTFRKAPRFFDVVTFTVGTSGSDTIINHNLGVTPGFVITKMTSTSSSWFAFHTSTPNQYLQFNATEPAKSWTWTSDDTSIDIGAFWSTAYAGATGIAYFFAHDPLGPSGDGSDGLIACGSYTGNGSTTGPEIDLGWEPQWLLIKDTTTSSWSWYLVDNMRGFSETQYTWFAADTNAAESALTDRIVPTSTGFKLVTSLSPYNANGSNYVYIAIRRGPMRQPTSGTEVFAIDQDDGVGSPAFISGFPVDFNFYRNVNTLQGAFLSSRLTGNKYMQSTSTASESSSAGFTWDYMDGFRTGPLTTDFYGWMFRRAPGFFDVVAYTGDGVAGRTVSHNLGVAPEMMWIKRRDVADDWSVYYGDNTDYLYLNSSQASVDNSFFWNDTSPTDSAFTVGTNGGVNASASTYVAYLFATLPGVSKVGSYTGNGTSQTINCGFTSGARFILIKRTDSTGDWYVWDTARGIVAANDPHLSLNTTAAEVTTDDSVDPDSSGFIVNQVAATNINVNAASYIYYAVS